MKKSIPSYFVTLLFTSATFAQVDIDKSIVLSGSAGQRKISNLETPIAGTDAANKDYVDTKVSAGGGNLSMISNESSSTMTFGTAIRYCKNLNEGGYTDWRLPSNQELVSLISKGGTAVSNDGSTNIIWVSDLMAFDSYYGTYQRGRFRLSDGYGTRNDPTSSTDTRVRCVR